MCSRSRPFDAMATKRRPPIRSKFEQKTAAETEGIGERIGERIEPSVQSGGASSQTSQLYRRRAGDDLDEDKDDLIVDGSDYDDDDDNDLDLPNISDRPSPQRSPLSAQGLYPDLKNLGLDNFASIPKNVKSFSFSHSDSKTVRYRSNMSPSDEVASSPKGCSSQEDIPSAKARPKDADSPNFFVIFVLVVIVAICVLFYVFTSREKPLLASSPAHQAYLRFKEATRRRFPSQPARVWSNFEAPIRRVFRDGVNSEEPAVVVLAGHAATARCLATATARLLPSLTNDSVATPLLVEGNQLKSMSPLAAKNRLEDELRSHLDAGGKTVVLFGVDLLQPQTALLLHSFADHENAPFKDTYFILVAEGALSGGGMDVDRMKEAERFITRRWEEILEPSIGVDAAAALLARVANNVVVTVPESEGSCGADEQGLVL